MVNIPKTRRTFCRKCGKHTPHGCSIYKTGAKRLNSLGTRRYHRKIKGYGGKGKPVNRKLPGNVMPTFRKKAKQTRKLTVRLECRSCGQRNLQVYGRSKRVEMGAERKRKSKTERPQEDNISDDCC